MFAIDGTPYLCIYGGMKFEAGDHVEHLKSGGHYRILGTPDIYQLEATGESAYAYRKTAEDARIWVRCQTEMEDGRFELV